MKYVQFISIVLTSVSFCGISWQSTEDLSSSLTFTSATSNEVALDPSGNALNVLTYVNELLTAGQVAATLHSNSGNAWGSLVTNINAGVVRTGLTPFAGATGKFVIPMQNNVGGNLYSRTITTSGTLGTVKTITDEGSSTNASLLDMAGNPSGTGIIIFGRAVVGPPATFSTLYSLYTPSSDTWSTPDPIQDGAGLEQQIVAADAGGNYGVALLTTAGAGQAAFKIGGADFSTLATFDTDIATASMAITAQVKSGDTDGIFMIAYIKSDDIYAQLKPAGSTTTLVDYGQISVTGDTIIDGSIRAVLNPFGNGVVAWQTDSNTIIAAKYNAATNTFGTPVTVATNASINNISTDSYGEFHIYYTFNTNNVVTMYSVSLSNNASIWGTPTTVYANVAADTLATTPSAATNPRNIYAAYAWGTDAPAFFATFGTSIYGGNHGASGGPLFRKSKSALRPGRRPFR